MWSRCGAVTAVQLLKGLGSWESLLYLNGRFGWDQTIIERRMVVYVSEDFGSNHL